MRLRKGETNIADHFEDAIVSPAYGISVCKSSWGDGGAPAPRRVASTVVIEISPRSGICRAIFYFGSAEVECSKHPGPSARRPRARPGRMPGCCARAASRHAGAVKRDELAPLRHRHRRHDILHECAFSFLFHRSYSQQPGPSLRPSRLRRRHLTDRTSSQLKDLFFRSTQTSLPPGSRLCRL
jgi:hypothetical protein